MSETLVLVDSQNATRERRESGKKHSHQRVKTVPRTGNDRACWINLDMDGLRNFLWDRYPRKTAESVAHDTGIPVKTVRRWLYEKPSEPSGTNICRLYIAYRAPFLAAALVNCPDWLNDEAVAAKNAELDRRMEDLKALKAEVGS